MDNEKTPTRVYKAGDLLTFTINPQDTFQYFGAENRFNKFRHNMHQKFLDIFDQDLIPYWSKIELSEPVNEIKYPGPRLHLHGFIKLKTEESVFKFLCDTVYELTNIGITKINHCLNESMLTGWENYLQKQTPIFKNKCRVVSTINSKELPKDIFTLNT